MQTSTQAMDVPLRNTPGRFRVLLVAGTVLVALGYFEVLQHAAAGQADLFRQPGFLLLAALVLLADLYPLVPSMRDVRANVTFAWSAALSMAAVLAYGPTASLLFLVSGLTAALSRVSGRWWHVALNMVLFGLIGVAVAWVSGLAQVVDPHLMQPGAWRLAARGLRLAIVVIVLHALLIGLALTQLGASTWRGQRDRFGKSVRIWGASLITAPLLAALALEGPWALLSMAVIIASLNHLSTMMLRSTAASRTDGLTGLANRLTLIRVLSERIAALQPGQAVTLLLIDLNRFKDVNDKHGHLVGDEVLAAVAHRLRAAADPSDLVARYGGDEFAVVLGPDTGQEQALASAATFRATLAEPVSIGDIRVVVGGSIGIAAATDPTMDVLGLLELADQDMYRSKRSMDAAAVWARGAALRASRARADSVAGGEARSPSARPARRPVWSVTLQGASALPGEGWPGVHWSSSPWSVTGHPGRSLPRRPPLDRGTR